MMNRGVMDRQMFAKGGAAVPNEYKGFSQLPEAVQMRMDPAAARKYQEGGPVAQGDSIENLQAQADRMGITLRELFALMVSPPFAPSGNMAGPEATMMRPNETYSEVTPMAQGGNPAMEQGVGAMMPAPQEAAMPQGGEQAIDPQMLEQMLASAGEGVQDLESVDNFEQMMNSIRGDDASVQERRAELADIVGEEDAAQTPESVLALAQPAIMMASVDQGIGGLAQDEMSQPVQGAMAEGIMSTVAPPQPAAPGPEMMGGPPPVNFNQGGLVRRGDNQPVVMMQAGGDPFANAQGRLGELARERMAVREGLIGDPAGRLQEQKDLTQAQMLFDVANTALAFAGPMQGEPRGLSTAERLARAAQQTQLLPTIGARAAQLGEFKSGLAKEKQALQLAALGSAETALAAEAKAAEDVKMQKLKGAQELSQMSYQSMLDTDRQSQLQTEEYDLKEGLENVKSRLTQARDNANFDNTLKGKERQFQLDEQLARVNADLKLTELGHKTEYEMSKMALGHDYAVALQDTRLAVDKEIKSIDQAIAMKNQEIEEAKMLQTAAAQTSKQQLEQEKLALEKERHGMEMAKAGLEVFGTQGKNKAQSILANKELLDGYANNTLTEPQTLQVNSAIDMLSTRETIVQDGKAVKTGGNIPEAARQAVLARSKLTVPEDQTLLMPRDLKRITAEPVRFGEAVSKIMSSVPDASIAFGSDAVARNVVNTVTEALTFGLASAPFESTQKAISAVEQLNLDTLTHFQDIKELRDSVALMNKLENQTANPNAFLTGDTKAKNKTKTVLDTIDELISVLDLKIENISDVEELNEAKLGKQKALQLRSGFEVIERAYAKLGSGGRTTTPEVEAKQDQILFGD